MAGTKIDTRSFFSKRAAREATSYELVPQAGEDRISSRTPSNGMEIMDSYYS